MRVLRVLGMLMMSVVGGVVGYALAAGDLGYEVKAKNIQLVDSRGNTRAALTFLDVGGVGFVLYDSDGRPRAGLMLEGQEEIPTLAVADPSGCRAAELRLESPGRPSLRLADERDTTRLALGLDEDGAPVLKMAAADGLARVAVAVRSDSAPAIDLWGEGRQPRWSAP